MDGITYATHTQTVYLKASKPPPFLQSVRHWNIFATDGILPEIDPSDNATYLGTLPSRIATVPMLHRSCGRQMMTVLLLVWIYALCCRFLQPRLGITRLHVYDSSFLVLLVLCFAYADQLLLCETMVGAATALWGEGLDAMGMLVVMTLAHQGWYITAIASTVSYAVCARDSREIDHEPDFATFLARLQPYPLAPNASENEERGCLVCFSFDETLFRLPCHPSHRACKSCLSELHRVDKSHCPHCSTALFIYASRTYKNCLRHLIVTNAILAFTFASISLALQLYKGHVWDAGDSIVKMVFCLPSTRVLLYKLDKKRFMALVPIEYLWFFLGIAAFLAWLAAAQLQVWDQVTLWDGVVLKGVEVWDTHEVVREWYAAAV